MKSKGVIDNSFINKYGDKGLAVNKLPPLLQNMLKYVTDADLTALDEMSEVMLVNIEFMSDTIRNVKQYCLTEGDISTEDIYQTSTKELI